MNPRIQLLPLLVALAAPGCGRAPGAVLLAREVIDFGPSMPGGATTRSIEVVNGSGAHVTVTRLVVDGGPFVRASGPSLPLRIPRGARGALVVHFHPSNPGVFAGQAMVEVAAGTDLLELRADLRGAATGDSPCGEAPCTAGACDPPVVGTCTWSEGEGNRCELPASECTALTWAPSFVDFGWATPGIARSVPITFANRTARAIVLRNLATDAPEFAVEPAGNLLVPPSGTATAMVVATPEDLGTRRGTLSLEAEVEPGAPRRIGIPLRIGGGGPDIAVFPSVTLNFGKVAWFPTLTRATRNLMVMNVGTRPDPPDPSGNLLLGPIRITPSNPLTERGEFSVTPPSSYDPRTGLVAQVGSNAAEFKVTLDPAALGLREAELTIPSNDPDEPEVRIALVADVVTMTPCAYRVTPELIDFGPLPPPEYRDVPVTIENLGTLPDETCLVGPMEIDGDPQAVALFSVPSGTTETRELPPRGKLNLLVRAWAKPGATGGDIQTATLRIAVSSPTRPEATVTLRAGP